MSFTKEIRFKDHISDTPGPIYNISDHSTKILTTIPQDQRIIHPDPDIDVPFYNPQFHDTRLGISIREPTQLPKSSGSTKDRSRTNSLNKKPSPSGSLTRSGQYNKNEHNLFLDPPISDQDTWPLNPNHVRKPFEETFQGRTGPSSQNNPQIFTIATPNNSLYVNMNQLGETSGQTSTQSTNPFFSTSSPELRHDIGNTEIFPGGDEHLNSHVSGPEPERQPSEIKYDAEIENIFPMMRSESPQIRSSFTPIELNPPRPDEHPASPDPDRVLSSSSKPFLTTAQLAYFGVICGAVCLFFGILELILWSKAQCVFSGIWQIILGFIIIPIEGVLIPRRTIFNQLPFILSATKLLNNQPYWVKSIIYVVASILSIATCATWASGVGCGFVIVLGLCYGIKQIEHNRKLGRVEVYMSSGTDQRPRSESPVPVWTMSTRYSSTDVMQRTQTSQEL